jgi:hypothetical protein
MIIHKWISSDCSEFVPTTDVKINLNLNLNITCVITLPFIEVAICVFTSVRILAGNANATWFDAAAWQSRNQVKTFFISSLAAPKICSDCTQHSAAGLVGNLQYKEANQSSPQ